MELLVDWAIPPLQGGLSPYHLYRVDFLLSVVGVQLLVDCASSSTYSDTIILQMSMILWTKGKQPFIINLIIYSLF